VPGDGRPPPPGAGPSPPAAAHGTPVHASGTPDHAGGNADDAGGAAEPAGATGSSGIGKVHDVAIIGAGIVGASIAWHLAGSARVAWLEAESAPGYHTTGRSAALFAAGYGPPAVRALTRASRTFYAAPPAGFTAVPLWSPRGALFAARADQIAGLGALARTLRAEGIEAIELDMAGALARVPVLRPESVAAALLDPSAFDLDVDALLQGFARGARARGVAWRPAARVRSQARPAAAHAPWRIVTADGAALQARVVVNAAGAWLDAVAALAGVAPVGLVPRRRTAFRFDAPVGLDIRRWPAVVAADESWYFKPDAGLLLGSPANADPTVPHDVLPEDLDVAIGVDRLEAATTLRIGRPRTPWAGLRCFVADGEPVCGFAPDAPGFFWAGAVGGYGIQSAPAFGGLCAALVLGRPLPAELATQGLDLAALRPDRGSLAAAPPGG
jgi:D-arginine dehydrogenase